MPHTEVLNQRRHDIVPQDDKMRVTGPGLFRVGACSKKQRRKFHGPSCAILNRVFELKIFRFRKARAVCRGIVELFAKDAQNAVLSLLVWDLPRRC